MSGQDMDIELSQGERLLRAQKLMESIAECEWEDAELVMSTLLYEFRVGSSMTAYKEYEDEAEFWASIATYDELLAYFIETGKRLVNRKLGTRGRIKMIERIMDDLPPEEVENLLQRKNAPQPKDTVA